MMDKWPIGEKLVDAADIATSAHRAAADLLDTRIAAIREIVSPARVDAVVDTEHLASRVEVWKRSASDAISAYGSAIEVFESATSSTSAENGDLHDLSCAIDDAKEALARSPAAAAFSVADERASSHETDPVFAYLYKRVGMAALDHGISRGDRWLAKLSRYAETRNSYFASRNYREAVSKWESDMRDYITCLSLDLVQMEQDAADAAMAAEALVSGAREAVDRARAVVWEYLGTGASVFAALDAEASCLLARELAAVAVQSRASERPSVPFAAEQERLIEVLEVCRGRLKEKPSATA